MIYRVFAGLMVMSLALTARAQLPFEVQEIASFDQLRCCLWCRTLTAKK